MDEKIDLLRHTLGTLAYRGGKALRGAPPGFSSFRAGETTRTPGQILAHICDLLDWALSHVDGNPAWHDSTPLDWDQETARFFTALDALDKRLGNGGALACPAEKLFQGPIADAFTHVGQISMLRRMAGSPVRGENYYKAEISAGHVGPEQAKPKFEFN